VKGLLIAIFAHGFFDFSILSTGKFIDSIVSKSPFLLLYYDNIIIKIEKAAPFVFPGLTIVFLTIFVIRWFKKLKKLKSICKT